MRALVWEGPRNMQLRTADDPRPGPDEVLIKVAHSGICGSELGGYLGHNSLRKPPLVMGHEFSGVVVERGSNLAEHRLPTGTRVTVNPLIPGHGSPAATRGRQNLSRNRQILGIHRPGSFAEYVVAPAHNTYPLPDNLDLETAALTEPMACAIRAARMADVGPHDTALVTGLGPIGLLTAMVLAEAGLRAVFATDIDADRRRMGDVLRACRHGSVGGERSGHNRVGDECAGCRRGNRRRGRPGHAPAMCACRALGWHGGSRRTPCRGERLSGQLHHSFGDHRTGKLCICLRGLRECSDLACRRQGARESVDRTCSARRGRRMFRTLAGEARPRDKDYAGFLKRVRTAVRRVSRKLPVRHISMRTCGQGVQR